MRRDYPILYQKISLPLKIKRPILAVGTQTKNTICFARGEFAYLSPLHPDLNNPGDFLNFKKDVEYFLKKHPKIIACDLHPEYLSSKYAHELFAIPACPAGRRYPLSAIQHHHAHIASCMVDNGLKNQKVIGVAFDGTGLGTDNTLWGAEFLICDYKNFKRIAHLREIPLLGQEKAISEPWRLSSFWLYSIYKDNFLNLGIRWVKKINKKKWQVLKNMYLAGINSPFATSAGRLFDAVASLVLEKYKANFEAELAVELEKLATSYKCQVTSYKFKVIKDKDDYILDPLPLFKEIIADLKAKEPKEKIAYRFHLTVAEMIRKVCLILREKTKINKVILSGGVFQNNLLLSLSLDLLYKEGFKAFTHKNLSCNDSGVSLGQAAIVNLRS